MAMVTGMATTADTMDIAMAFRPDGITGARLVGAAEGARPDCGNTAAASAPHLQLMRGAAPDRVAPFSNSRPVARARHAITALATTHMKNSRFRVRSSEAPGMTPSITRTCARTDPPSAR